MIAYRAGSLITATLVVWFLLGTTFVMLVLSSFGIWAFPMVDLCE